jgi:hypothetical protein
LIGFVVPGAKAYNGPCFCPLTHRTILYQASLIFNLSPMKLLDVHQPLFKDVCPASHAIKSVGNMTVFSFSLLSPLGRNTFICYSRYGFSLSNIHMLNRKRIVRYVGRQLDRLTETNVHVYLLSEVMNVKSGVLTLSEPVFSCINIDYDRLSTAVQIVEFNYFRLCVSSVFLSIAFVLFARFNRNENNN